RRDCGDACRRLARQRLRTHNLHGPGVPPLEDRDRLRHDGRSHHGVRRRGRSAARCRRRLGRPAHRPPRDCGSSGRRRARRPLAASRASALALCGRGDELTQRNGMSPRPAERGRVGAVARPSVDAVLNLETLYWVLDPLRDDDLESDVNVWPVYFKIDGETALVSDAPESFGKLIGTATVAGTTGLGKVGKLKIGGSVAIPAAIGRWTGQVVPIPLGSNLNLGPDVAGIFGAAVLVVQPSDLEEDALLAGHEALNEGVQTALDELIADLKPFQQDVTPNEIDALVAAVRSGIESAV